MAALRRRASVVSWVAAWLLAIALHIAFLLLFAWLVPADPGGRSARRLSVTLRKQAPSEPKRGQVVTTNPLQANRRLPPKTRFLAETDNAVPRQTRARTHSRAAATPPALPPDSLSQAASGSPPTVSPESPLESGLSAVSPQSPDRDRPQRRKGPRSMTIALAPSPHVLQQALGPSGWDDLSDIEEGDVTALNTRAFRFASFFNRVKEQVRPLWRPDWAIARNDPTGEIAGIKDRTTVVLVVLNPQGDLIDTHVYQPSGVPFLDDAAVDAIRRAAPFPHVPPGLVRDGRVRFLFQFTVKMHSGPVLRIRRIP